MKIAHVLTLIATLNSHHSINVRIIWKQLQDVVSLLLAAGCPDIVPGGTLPRRRGSGQAVHGRSKEIASSVLWLDGDEEKCFVIGHHYCDFAIEKLGPIRPKTIWLWPIRENLVKFREMRVEVNKQPTCKSSSILS